LTTQGGGSLASKFCITFGKESTLGDTEMNHIIEQQQNLYLQTTKQRIVRNLNDIDEEIYLEPDDDVDMEGSGTTIRVLKKNLDNKVNALFHSMEHTNTYGVYRLLFDETNTEQVDNLLATIDESLDAFGD
jgi:hypothetical protein